MPRDAYRQSESELQAAICDLLDLYASQGRLRYWAVPNQLPRPSLLVKLIGKHQVAKIYALIEASLQRIGKKPGALDLTIAFRNGFTLFMEVKSGTGKPTKEQEELLAWFRDNGHLACVVRSIEEVQDALRWGFGKVAAP